MFGDRDIIALLAALTPPTQMLAPPTLPLLAPPPPVEEPLLQLLLLLLFEEEVFDAVSSPLVAKVAANCLTDVLLRILQSSSSLTSPGGLG